MGGEAESRDGSAGHSQSSEPDLAAGAAVELRPTEEEVPATWMLTPAQPVFRDGNYGGSFCELLVAETIQEYLKFHGLQETHRALADALSKSGLPAAFGASAVELPSEPKGHAVQVELAVLQALRAFDEGQQEAFFQRWRALVPPSPTGSSLELQLYVYFGTYPTRKVLAEKDPSLPLPTADWTELKSFLASRPTWPTEANSSLSSLYALPFVPQAHQNSLLRFIFEESWSEKLRSDVQAFMTAYTSTRHAPSLRHLAGAIIVSKTPPSCPPAHSWHELLRIADLGWASAATALKQQAFENMPSDQPEAKPELLNWLSTGGGKILPDLRKQVFELRGRLGALARHPDEPPVAPSRVQETQRSLRPSIQSLARAPSSAEWEPQGGSSPSGVPVLQDRLWPREVLRGSSASSLGGSHSNAGAVRRLHSARSIESRARTATALLPVPPALDFGRMASQMGGAEEKETDMPPILSVLRAVLRRLALPDEAIRPRRAFLAAFACFGALRALAARLPEMIGGDPQLREMSLAVMGVCSCEVLLSESRYATRAFSGLWLTGDGGSSARLAEVLDFQRFQGKRDPSGGVRGGLHQLECIFMGNQSFPHLLARRPHVNPTAGELVPAVCAVLFVPGLRAPEQPDEAAEPYGRRAIRTADPGGSRGARGGGSDMVSLDDLHFDISVAALFYLVNNSDPEIRTREVEG
ncbi:unnamed protein product [Durusdinium trenchii]|uniref:ARMC9 CTLH-like domain-containing protein n=1 Tax=Durusdinium trenchii TaxID=1381693 RepID=A0ABP0ICX4_9DINO